MNQTHLLIFDVMNYVIIVRSKRKIPMDFNISQEKLKEYEMQARELRAKELRRLMSDFFTSFQRK